MTTHIEIYKRIKDENDMRIASDHSFDKLNTMMNLKIPIEYPDSKIFLFVLFDYLNETDHKQYTKMMKKYKKAIEEKESLNNVQEEKQLFNNKVIVSEDRKAIMFTMTKFSDDVLRFIDTYIDMVDFRN